MMYLRTQLALYISLTLLIINNLSALGDIPPRDAFQFIFESNFENDQVGSYQYNDFQGDWNGPYGNERQSTLDILTENDGIHNNYMRGYFPSGTVGPSQGGWSWNNKLSGSITELYFSYDIRFKPGFQWALGGKVPGVSGSNGWQITGTVPSYGDGFSARMIWGSNGELMFYAYHQDQPGNYGDGGYWGDFKFVTGQWYNITFRIVLNTVINDVGNNDGILEGYIDGKLMVQLKKFRFRNYESINIDNLYVCSFFGGAGADYVSLGDEWIDTDNYVAYQYNNNVIGVPRGQELSSPTKMLLHPYHDFLDTDWKNSFKATGVSSAAVDLSWTDYPVPTNYILERQDGGSSTLSTIATLSYGTTTYTDNNVIPNTRYTYRLTANSTPSYEVIVTTSGSTLNSLPPQPNKLTASKIDSRSIVLNWSDNSTNETGFEIKRNGPNDFNLSKTFTLNSNTTSYTDSDIQPNSAYQYGVRAFNDNGYSEYTSVLQVNSLVSSAIDAPSQPSLLAGINITENSITLGWNDNASNETGFELLRTGPNDFSILKTITLGPNVTSYTDTDVLLNSAYQYWIRAFNANGYSEYTAVIQLSSLGPALPPAPSLLEGENFTDNSITIKWNDNSSNETGFIVKRAPALDPGDNLSITVDANDTSFVDNDLTPNTTYIYTVEAVNSAGNSAASNKKVASTLSVAETRRVKDGLVAYYNFGYDPYNLIRDLSGFGDPVDLKILQPASVQWNEFNRLEIKGNTTLVSTTSAKKIVKAIKQTNEITVECWIRPAEPFSSNDSRIVSLANNNNDIGFVMDQYYIANDIKTINFGSRLSTASTNEAGFPEIIPENENAYLNMQHVAFVHDSLGNETVFLNGETAATGFRPSSLSNWKEDFSLRLGSESDQSLPWTGTFYIMAIYNIALNSQQIKRNFTSGPCDSLRNDGMNYQLNVYPNPASEQVNISIIPDRSLDFVPPTMIRMQDLTGRVYYEKYLFNPNDQFQMVYDIHDLPKGLYIIQVISGNKSKSTKLVVQ
jgi:hypothetical protein